MKKYILLLLANLLVVGLFMQFVFKESGEKERLAYRFTFVCPQIWDDTAAGMKAADQELGTNTKCIGFKSLNETMQIEAIQKAIYSKADGIITAATSVTPELEAVINQAVKEKIPVVLVDSDLPESDRSCYIGTNNLEAGRMAAKDMIEATDGKAQIGILISDLDNSNQRKRVQGFREEIQVCEEMEIVRIMECDSDKIKVRKLFQQMLQENPRIDAVYCTEETASEIVGEQLIKMKLDPRNMHVIGFGMSENIWNYIETGYYDSSIVQDNYSQGYLAVAQMKDYINGKNRRIDFVQTKITSAKKEFDFEEWKVSAKNEEVVWKIS